MARTSKWFAIREHALHRAALADARYEGHSLEALRLEDRADTRRSKAWRSRDMVLARKAQARAERAYRDRHKWNAVADRAQNQIDKLKRQKERRPKKKKPCWEYILKVKYDGGKRQRGRARKHHSVWWDIRLRKRDCSRATKAELEVVVRLIRNGQPLPFHWERIDIAWDTGDRPSWDAIPERSARNDQEAETAQLALSPTLGRDAGDDFIFEDDEGDIIIGEERR
jgi:hypothetical protein